VNATEHYKAGRLGEATVAALQEVKTQPDNIAKRCLLSDLLCFAGDLDRADRHLDAAAQFSPAPAILLRRQLLRAELARRQFYDEGRVPELLDAPAEDLRLRMQAAIASRDGDLAGARKLLSQAEHCRTPVSGVCNGQAFESLSDLDELTSSFFEVFTATGKYYWVAFERIAQLEFLPPGTTQDLLWRCARLVLREEGDPLPGVVYVPVLYQGSHACAQDLVKLGRMTEWTGGGETPYRGLGQRLFQAGEAEVPILEMARIQFNDRKEV